MPMADERTPLYQFGGQTGYNYESPHDQFCTLVGVPSSVAAPGGRPAPKSLYGRATRRRAAQNCTYMFTATLSNTLLLSQVVLGAALTALGASESSHILITVFGALNTIIAGVVAYLKSRGQPMRARMFRDDLDRIVDEIENSEVMWLGISKGVHGYDEIAIDDSVSVRSEVARLTRLYDRAVRSNTMNDPDMYMGTGGTDQGAALRARPGQIAAPTPAPAPAVSPSPSPAAPAGAPIAPSAPIAVTTDPDESPATAKPKPPPQPTPLEIPKADAKPETETATPTPSAATPPAAAPVASAPASSDTPTSVPPASTGPAPVSEPPTSAPAPSTPARDPDESPATAEPKPAHVKGTEGATNAPTESASSAASEAPADSTSIASMPKEPGESSNDGTNGNDSTSGTSTSHNAADDKPEVNKGS